MKDKKDYSTIELEFTFEEYFLINEEARKEGLLLDDFITNILTKYLEEKE